jgi:hypothetical protein
MRKAAAYRLTPVRAFTTAAPAGAAGKTVGYVKAADNDIHLEAESW